MTERKSFWKGALLGALAVICAGLVCFGAYMVSGQHFKRIVSSETEKKLEELDALIADSYLHNDSKSDKELQKGLCKGYVEALGDPYSVYYDEEETKKLFERTSGEFSGIGALMSQNQKTGIVTVSEVYENSPAEKAGMKANDILYKVEGEEITGEALNDIVKKIQGKSGTKVSFTVLRGTEKEEITMTATRAKVETKTVRFEMKEDAIGYIRISEFDTVTYGQFVDAKQALEAQGMQGLVVDLRGNPGGNLDTVTDILKTLLPKGTIVCTEDRDGNREEIDSEGASPLTIPCAVLVNGTSASASEIFAGSMQDYGMAEIVGTTTYGKGVVQQVFRLTDGTAVKLTIAKYYTGKGQDIDGKGVQPDVEVEYQADAENPDADNQLAKALEVVKEKQK